MNKRPHHNNNHNHNIILQITHKMSLNRQKAEDMCQAKLRKISKVKSKLVQTVLVKNTLKYVQNCEHVSFSYDDEDIEDDEYEPFNKKLCKDISTDDIDDTFSVRTDYNTFDVSDDSVVPDNEVLEYLSDADYLNYL